jgi:hypothetical protein
VDERQVREPVADWRIAVGADAVNRVGLWPALPPDAGARRTAGQQAKLDVVPGAVSPTVRGTPDPATA